MSRTGSVKTQEEYSGFVMAGFPADSVCLQQTSVGAVRGRIVVFKLWGKTF